MIVNNKAIDEIVERYYARNYRNIIRRNLRAAKGVLDRHYRDVILQELNSFSLDYLKKVAPAFSRDELPYDMVMKIRDDIRARRVQLHSQYATDLNTHICNYVSSNDFDSKAHVKFILKNADNDFNKLAALEEQDIALLCRITSNKSRNSYLSLLNSAQLRQFLYATEKVKPQHNAGIDFFSALLEGTRNYLPANPIRNSMIRSRKAVEQRKYRTEDLSRTAYDILITREKIAISQRRRRLSAKTP